MARRTIEEIDCDRCGAKRIPVVIVLPSPTQGINRDCCPRCTEAILWQFWNSSNIDERVKFTNAIRSKPSDGGVDKGK